MVLESGTPYAGTKTEIAENRRFKIGEVFEATANFQVSRWDTESLIMGLLHIKSKFEPNFELLYTRVRIVPFNPLIGVEPQCYVTQHLRVVHTSPLSPEQWVAIILAIVGLIKIGLIVYAFYLFVEAGPQTQFIILAVIAVVGIVLLFGVGGLRRK